MKTVRRLTRLAGRAVAISAISVAVTLAGTGAAGAAYIANLQLVSYCNDDGSQCADSTIDSGFLQSIYAPADISFNILPTVTFNQTSTAFVTDFVGALFAHTANVNGPLGGADPHTLYVGVARDTDAANAGEGGIGFVGDQYGLVDASFGSADETYLTYNIAHQIGHMLGFGSNGIGEYSALPTSGGLMSAVLATVPSVGLYQPNIDVFQQSPFLQEVTVVVHAPGAALLFAMTISGLAATRRRRTG